MAAFASDRSYETTKLRLSRGELHTPELDQANRATQAMFVSARPAPFIPRPGDDGAEPVNDNSDGLNLRAGR